MEIHFIPPAAIDPREALIRLCPLKRGPALREYRTLSRTMTPARAAAAAAKRHEMPAGTRDHDFAAGIHWQGCALEFLLSAPARDSLNALCGRYGFDPEGLLDFVLNELSALSEADAAAASAPQ